MTFPSRWLVFILAAVAGGSAAPPAQETWVLDRLEQIGGHATTVQGHPKVIETPLGKAVEFNGIDDALFVDNHPLAGASAFTWEVIFRPDANGKPEQRFLHFQQDGAPTRLLFELRIVDGRWCLDSYARSGETGLALLDRTKLHTLGEWHHAATVYDGHQLRNYVDGVQEGAGEVALQPQGAGKASIGTRIDHCDYFKGTIRLTRMTRRALTPAEFLKIDHTKK